MIARKTLGELALALEQSRGQLDWKSPKIWLVERGVYRVQGSSGTYDVTCGRTEHNWFFVACTCQANLHGKHCYHGLKAYIKHVEIMKELKGL